MQLQGPFCGRRHGRGGGASGTKVGQASLGRARPRLTGAPVQLGKKGCGRKPLEVRARERNRWALAEQIKVLLSTAHLSPQEEDQMKT